MTPDWLSMVHTFLNFRIAQFNVSPYRLGKLRKIL